MAHAESPAEKAPLRSRPAAARAQPPALPAAASKSGAQGSLGTFFDALRALGGSTRKQHVRIVWLGDSHTNADFLSGSVRTLLQARFGDGGPGFVRIGTRPYRHDGVKLSREGSWNVDPDPPARRAWQDDGIFGLGGLRAEPEAGAAFSLQVSARDAAAAEPARFELSYALAADASFDVELGSSKQRVDVKTVADATPAGVRHLVLTAPLASQLLIAPERGRARLFGVVIERTEQPGVVLDTLGIDGARLETPLAWSEAAFVEEVELRAPELFVIAYGTNEAFDAAKVEKYAAQLSALVGRLRKAAARASCLVLGPTDAPLGEGSVPRVAEVSAVLKGAAPSLGCSFVSLQQLMGGEGSFAKGMKAKERLAQPDKLHLTPKGYQELGRALGTLLTDAYSAGGAELP